MPIEYKINVPVTVNQFSALLRSSTLGERRPIDDADCLAGMLKNCNLTVTAWDGENLVGMARSMTDFHYACYLSDLAVDHAFQKRGIGKMLLTKTRAELGPKCNLVLLAAPAANTYYERLGFHHNPRCWILGPNENMR